MKLSLKLYRITTTLNNPDNMAGFYKDDKDVYDFFKRNIGNEDKIRKRDLSFVAGKGYTFKNIDKTDFINCPTALLFSEKFFNVLGKELEQEMQFIPCKLICQNKDGCYSIMTDYLGTPVGAYDEQGNLVWERELDINGKVMPVGEKTFIPFRFQGQYEDEEIGLYYSRFRYYDPETGQYTQQDSIGLAGGNHTLYGYVYETLNEMDPFGLTWRDLLASGLGHHLFIWQ